MQTKMERVSRVCHQDFSFMQHDTRDLQRAFAEGPLEFREYWRTLPLATLWQLEGTLGELARCGRLLFEGAVRRDSLLYSPLEARAQLQNMGPLVSAQEELERLSLLAFAGVDSARAALSLALKLGLANYVCVIYNRVGLQLLHFSPTLARPYFWTALAAAELCEHSLYRERVMPMLNLAHVLLGSQPVRLGMSMQSELSRSLVEVCQAVQRLKRHAGVGELMSLQQEFTGWLSWHQHLAGQLLRKGRADLALEILLDRYERVPSDNALSLLAGLHMQSPLKLYWQQFLELDQKVQDMEKLRRTLPLYDFNTLRRLLGQDGRRRVQIYSAMPGAIER